MLGMASAHRSISAADEFDDHHSTPREDFAFVVDGAVDDDELSRLHREAFRACTEGFVPWSRRLGRHSICWVTAHAGERLVGFVNVIGDGGVHAVLLDTVVDPAYQRRGIGRGLVTRAVNEARTLGCRFVHANYDGRAVDFYERVCGFSDGHAGSIRLS
jgi:GNAT superfamily N-acetyltransferase